MEKKTCMSVWRPTFYSDGNGKRRTLGDCAARPKLSGAWNNLFLTRRVGLRANAPISPDYRAEPVGSHGAAERAAIRDVIGWRQGGCTATFSAVSPSPCPRPCSVSQTPNSKSDDHALARQGSIARYVVMHLAGNLTSTSGVSAIIRCFNQVVRDGSDAQILYNLIAQLSASEYRQHCHVSPALPSVLVPFFSLAVRNSPAQGFLGMYPMESVIVCDN